MPGELNSFHDKSNMVFIYVLLETRLKKKNNSGKNFTRYILRIKNCSLSWKTNPIAICCTSIQYVQTKTEIENKVYESCQATTVVAVLIMLQNEKGTLTNLKATRVA